MKVNDIFREGLLSDLKAIGQAAQRDTWSGQQQPLGKDPRTWAQSIAKAATGARQNANVLPVADAFTKSWTAVAQQINNSKGPGEAMDLSEYQKTFAAWLARETKTRPNMAQIEAMVTATEPKLIRDYLVTHFIPQYQRVMTNPVYTIPDGHKEKGIFIAANGQRSEVEYEWDSTASAFLDPVTGEKAGARQMQSMIASAMEKVTKGSTEPEIDLGRAGATESRKVRGKVLAEGGNVFKNSDGKPITQRINQTDVKPTLAWLEEMLPGLDLQNNTLGSTGIKDTSGDLDIAVDANKVTKEQLETRLKQWAVSQGFKPEDWVRKSGTAVHFLTPITGRPELGYVQTDFMFLQNVPWSKFVLGAMPPDSQYKGRERNVLMNSIAKSMGYKLNQIAGIADRATNEIITDDPDAVAKMLLNRRATREDLASVEAILAALARDPKRDEKLADFREHMARQGIPFEQPVSENTDLYHPVNDVHFLARLRDRIVNQGMVPIMEGVRIEHPEDMVFDLGSQGITTALAGITAAAKNPESNTVKWDGRPAIIFGRKPNGDFVLTDKAGFLAKGYDGLATSPQMIANIMAARGGERGELVALYQKLFPLLRAAVPQDFRGYIQGDLLYTSTPKVSNGAYVFQPNTVTYSVPVDSELGKQVGASEVAVVIHTSLEAPGATPQPIRAAALRPVEGLLILDPSLKEPRNIKLNAKALTDLKKISAQHGAGIDRLFNPQELRARKITNLPQLMKTYINSRVREGSFDNLVAGFGPWLQAREPAKAPRVFEWANENKSAVAAVFQAFLDLSSLKNDLVRQLDAQAHDVQASVNNEPGHEGYVGQGMKFVDRMRFSQANFARNNPDLT